MYLKAFILLMALTVSTSQFSFAKKIKKAAYAATLRTLLSHDVTEMSVEDAEKQMGNALYLDSRSKEEYLVSHLAGAVWVGYDDFDTAQLSHLDKNRQIIVYCSVGYRSEKVTEKMVNAGFTKVANLYGGIFEWVNQDHEVVNAMGKTKRVHAYNKVWGIWLDKGEKVFK